MRSVYPLLLVVIFGFVLFSLFTSKASEDPIDEANRFLAMVAKNDTAAALREFGDNTCHCAPKGGYEAYLSYEAAHEPNIAFMLGEQMSFGKPRVKQLPYNGSQYIMPWDRPEDVVIYAPVEFAPEHRPYFLPMDSAFGLAITEADLKKFQQNPTESLRAFTLRLRRTLKPGLVHLPDPNAKKSDGDKAEDLGLLGPEAIKYLHPKDAGVVTLPDGSTEPLEKFAASLPRLKSIEIAMKTVRRGSFKHWAIKKIVVGNATLIVDGKEIHLATTDSESESKPAAVPTGAVPTGNSTAK